MSEEALRMGMRPSECLLPLDFLSLEHCIYVLWFFALPLHYAFKGA